jgi:SEC-C motif
MSVTATEPAGTAAAGLVPEALTTPPVWEKQVLEVALTWPGLEGDEAWAAERLRVFLLTWDPFEWRPDRPVAFATSTRRRDGAGLVMYLPYWQALALADDDAASLPAVLGQLAESVLSVAGEQRGAITGGAYAEGVASKVRPLLLSRIPDRPERAVPSLGIVGTGWEAIQFDVLEDLAQDLFGPADLDRSPLRFSDTGEGRAACPGCAGQAVEFPDGIKDAQDAICAVHRGEALRITTARLEAAKASNPAGWEALLDAGQRLLEPHLPNGLGPRLVAAAGVETPATADLVAQSALVVGAARLMTGLPDPETALGGRLAPVRRWLEHFPSDLAARGLSDSSSQVAVAAEELLTAPSAAELEAAAAEAMAAVEDAGPTKPQPFRRDVRVGRNAACPCGSGKKYKFCHGAER